MRKHNGMRPQDIIVLVKLLTLDSGAWQGKHLAAALCISPAEISDALRRCQYARLLQADGRTVQRQTVMRFLEHGLPYVFPVHLTGFVQGTPTAWSALPGLMPQHGTTLPTCVWEDPAGTTWGLSVSPLYPTLPAAAHQDAAWHQILALLDVLRLGMGPLRSSAHRLLSRRLLDKVSNHCAE
ncbi:hypothetical protein [Hymenobacter mucosus]|uniref:Uncharacterized protein n=1 Tax=Hymenobacter mucosus TaxID=1411120 RepID=A0A238Z7C7_9BACT|nr:hypothetical protein [Hymenobacter mucosus]SNR79336.1 hypothetical protein SAMN06269173_10711 [Hymenobacter mucosus]